VYFDVERKIYVENPTSEQLYTGKVTSRGPPPVLKPIYYSMVSADEVFGFGDGVTLEDMKRILYRELYGTVTGRFTGRDVGAYYDDALEARPKGNRAPIRVFPKEGSLMGTYIGPDNFLKGRRAIVRFPLHGAFGTTPTCKCLVQFDEQARGWHEHLLIHFQLEDDSPDN
jgi:hypothetical protein